MFTDPQTDLADRTQENSDYPIAETYISWDISNSDGTEDRDLILVYHSA